MNKNTQKDGMGKLYVIEGLDGSGKATQSELLYEYESDSSALVRMYLRGDFGSDPSDVNAYAASSFYAADRFAGYKADRSGTVFLSGFFTTNMTFWASRRRTP